MQATFVANYFLKLHNILYAIIIIPLVVMAYGHLEIQSGKISGTTGDEQLDQIIITTLSIIVVLEWIASQILFTKKLNHIRSIVSLRQRLLAYRQIVMVRFSIVAFSCLFLSIGYYMTNSQWLTVMFIGAIVLISFFWPTPRNVASDLKLMTVERDIVLYKQDIIEDNNQ